MNEISIENQIADLAKQYGRLVFQTAFRILGNCHYAEDVTQEVFLKLFRKTKKTFHEVQHWPAYLKAMAASSAMDVVRKQARLSEDSLLEYDEDERNSERYPSPLNQLMIDRDLAQFRFALTRLTDKEANVFILRFIEEFSYIEIAECLQLSNSDVGVTIHRAQKKILDNLDDTNLSGEKYEVVK